MTGGLIQLVAYGTQDIFLTKDPQITFFKTVYRRHTNFSTEMISQHFPSTPNFGDKISATISRSGDLIRKMYIVFTLPPIPILKENGVPSEKLKFAWVKKLGYALIKSVEIEIGGQSIDKHYGEWLHIWNELTGPKNRGFDIMIGNTDEVNKFNCCKSTFTLYVPLQFYFCRYSGLALPIVNLQYHEIKINLELSHIKSTYIRAPKNYIKICNDLVQFTDYEYIVQDVDGTTAFGQFIYFDKLTNLLYYNRISSNTFQSVSGTFAPSTIKTELRKTENQKYNIKGSTSGFIVQPYVNEKEKVYALPKIPNFNIIECYLLVEYIYLKNN